MGTLLDRPWITCCTREDAGEVKQPPYLHKCGCPEATLECVSSKKVATLCGFDEIGIAHPGYGVLIASPPVRYRVRERQLIISGDDADTYAVPTSTTATYDQNDCSISRTDPILVKRKSNDSVAETLPDGLDPAGVSAPDGPAPVYTPTSIESVFTISGFDFEEIRNEYLSIPDTELDALARATETAGTSCSSLYELRTDDFVFTVRTSSYAIKASNLMVGARYTARVLIERRPAIKDPDGYGYVDANGDPSVWTTEDDESATMIDEYTFTATAREQIVPTTGTWTDADSDGEIDTAEVTPAVELPNESGWEYRIKTVHIELALTAA